MDSSKQKIKQNNERKSNRETKLLTREYIRTALIYLMKDIPFEKITTTAIINRAGVSRGGFYRNYTCKEDVLNDISSTFYEKLVTYYFDELYPLEPYERYIKLFYKLIERKDMFKLLLTSNCQSSNIFDFHFFVNHNITHPTAEEHYHYIGMAYAHRFIIREWFQNGMKESPEEMAVILCNTLECPVLQWYSPNHRKP